MSISVKNDKKLIILHVGLHKTGTTSIQETLYYNNHLLEKKGFFYPKCWPANHSFPLYSSFCDKPEKYRQNIYAKADPKKIIDTNKSYLFNLKQEYQEHFSDHLIISGEDISNLTQKNINALKRYLEMITHDSNTFQILIYLRDPVTLAISLVQEWIKGGFNFNQSLLNTKKEIHGLYQNKISKFQNVFGRENVHIYTYESTLSETNGPVVHFLKTLGFTNTAIDQFHFITSNPSISQPGADIVS